MGRFFPHVHGGDGGGGRSKSKDCPLNLAESLPVEEGRGPPLFISFVEGLLCFLAEMCSLIISSSDLGCNNVEWSCSRFCFTSTRSSKEDGGVTFKPGKKKLIVQFTRPNLLKILQCINAGDPPSY